MPVLLAQGNQHASHIAGLHGRTRATVGATFQFEAVAIGGNYAQLSHTVKISVYRRIFCGEFFSLDILRNSFRVRLYP